MLEPVTRREKIVKDRAIRLAARDALARIELTSPP